MTQQPDLNRFEAPFFFFSCQRRGELTHLSPSVEQILGYQPEQLIGTSYYDLLVPGHTANAQVHRAGAPCGREVCHVVRAMRADNGDTKVLSIQIYNEANDGDTSSISHGIALDVTLQWEVIQVLQRRREELTYNEEELTAREKKVLELLLEGALNKTMARELDVSERTIEMDRARLMKKFSAQSAAQLVSIATEARLLSNALDRFHSGNSREFFGNPYQFCGRIGSSSPVRIDDN